MKTNQLLDFENDLFFEGNVFGLKLTKIISCFNQEFPSLEKHQYEYVYQKIKEICQNMKIELSQLPSIEHDIYFDEVDCSARCYVSQKQ
jgi:phenylalanyl-tRNA synthetase alpha subunit